MKNITILDQSFFDSKKKKSILQKKVFGDTTFHLSKKKFLTRVFDPFPIKLFFFGVRHKKTKKLTAPKIVMFSILFNDSFKKMTASKKYQITPGRSKY